MRVGSDYFYFLVGAKMKYLCGQATRPLVIQRDAIGPDKGSHEIEVKIRDQCQRLCPVSPNGNGTCISL